MDKSVTKIIGNTTATSMPRSNWDQADETKADFILNKPNPVLLTEQQLTDNEKLQARTNIDAVSTIIVDDLSTEIAEMSSAVAYIDETDNENIETEEVTTMVTNVDSALSTISSNPIQNKAVAEAINAINERLSSLDVSLTGLVGDGVIV